MKAIWKNIVLQVLQQLADLVLLNLVWLAFSLPVFTIGATTAAMFTVADSVREGGGVRVLHTFWTGFCQNFRRSLVPTIMVMAVAVLLMADFMLARSLAPLLRAVLFGALVSMSLLLCLTASHLFPMLAATALPWRVLLLRAFTLGMNRPGRALLIVFMNLLPFILAVVSPQLFLHGIPLWIGLYFSGVSYVTAWLLKVDLKRMVDEP